MILGADNYFYLFSGDGLSRRQTASEHSYFIYFIFDFCCAFFFSFETIFLLFILYFLFWHFFFFFTLLYFKFCVFSLHFILLFAWQLYSAFFLDHFTLHRDFLTFLIYIPNTECRKTHVSREARQEGSLQVYFYSYFVCGVLPYKIPVKKSSFLKVELQDVIDSQMRFTLESNILKKAKPAPQYQALKKIAAKNGYTFSLSLRIIYTIVLLTNIKGHKNNFQNINILYYICILAKHYHIWTN